MKKFFLFVSTLLSLSLQALFAETLRYQLVLYSGTGTLLSRNLPVESSAEYLDKTKIALLTEKTFRSKNAHRVLLGGESAGSTVGYFSDWIRITLDIGKGSEASHYEEVDPATRIGALRFTKILGDQRTQNSLSPSLNVKTLPLGSVQLVGNDRFVELSDILPDLNVNNGDEINIEAIDSVTRETIGRFGLRYWENLEKQIANVAQTRPTSLELVIADGSGKEFPISTDTSAHLKVGSDNRYLKFSSTVTLSDGRKAFLPAKAIDIQSVRFEVTGKSKVVWDWGTVVTKLTEAGLLISDLASELQLKTGDKVLVYVTKIGNRDDNQREQKFAFTYMNNVEFYDPGIPVEGVYFPTNLYSVTTVKKGLLFSALPIGAAFGGKLNFYRADGTIYFFGLGVMANWQIYQDSGQTDKNSFVVTSISYGLHVNLSDYLNLGCTWSANLGNISDSAPFAVVLGFGKRTMDLFQH